MLQVNDLMQLVDLFHWNEFSVRVRDTIYTRWELPIGFHLNTPVNLNNFCFLWSVFLDWRGCIKEKQNRGLNPIHRPFEHTTYTDMVMEKIIGSDVAIEKWVCSIDGMDAVY